ncbi:MAG: glycosyltransferase [Acidobacteriota bacterium]
MPEELGSPVFYDPKNKRWPRIKFILFATFVVVTCILTVLTMSVLSTPSMPALGLAFARNPPQASRYSSPEPFPTATVQPTATPVPTRTPLPTLTLRPTPTPRPILRLMTRYGRQKQRLLQMLLQRQSALQSRRAPSRSIPRAVTPTPPSIRDSRTPISRATPVPFSPPTPGPLAHSDVIGFFVNWDDTSLTSLRQNMTQIDKLIPEWLHLADADGNLSYDDPNRQKQVLELVQKLKPSLAVVPLVNNYDDKTQDWDGETLAKMLANSAARARTIQNLLAFVRANKTAGISIDFEAVPENSQADLRAFMRDLSAAFHPLGLEVSESIPLEDVAFDARLLAQSNDYLILMAYDEHWGGGEPGPVASQSWFTDALKQRLAQAPASKYVIAIGNYGYDWDADDIGADVSFQDAITEARYANAHIRLERPSLNPTFEYTDDNNKLHHVWYLDAVTTFDQLAQAQPYGPRGFALWRLGSEDPSIWQVLEHRNKLDASSADGLRDLHYGYDIDYEGRGEVLKVTATPSDGVRTISYDPKSNLILNEVMETYPSPFVVTRWGGGNKKRIALTFDDGPDSRFTAPILDILKQYQAPGAFFIVGMNASGNSDLLQRIVNEGHEIGNHTFSHPDISVISSVQLDLELNATERLFESRLGRRSLLFRPPYAEDVEPETPDQVKPLLLSSGRGYYTIGMRIDPLDWRSPGVDEIVQETINQAVTGEGNIVLLHDGGGDRSQTVVALPKIIEGLRARGFELVQVSDLLGLSRDQVMPPIPARERAIAQVNDTGFQLLAGIRSAIANLFVVGIVLGVLRVLVIGLLATAEWVQVWLTRYPKEFKPWVSVIVPAYNEEKVISKSISALLATDYPDLDIIVVDDGSTDDTAQRLATDFGGNPRVRVFTKKNAGKSQALNFGIHRTRAEIIVAQDADTILRRDAIEKLVRHFANPHVAAVAGNAKVGNRTNLLTRWQALEYITSQNLDRRAFAILNCITVVPGAIGAWRRDLILRAGGFTRDTLAEDADLTLRILHLGYQIDYEDRAIAYTEAPDSVHAFVSSVSAGCLGRYRRHGNIGTYCSVPATGRWHGWHCRTFSSSRSFSRLSRHCWTCSQSRPSLILPGYVISTRWIRPATLS